MSDSSHRLQLYLAHRNELVDYATPIVGCRASAEDVVQEAWLRFISSTAAVTQPAAYLYRIVRNLALDHLRRGATQRVNDDPALLDELPDHSANPETRAVSQNELQLVCLALHELPERTRQAFELYRLQGQTLQQVADTLQISVGLAHQLVHAALRHCTERLGGADE